MNKLNQLDESLQDWLDETNRWKLPKGMSRGSRLAPESRDFERGVFLAFMFVRKEIRRLQRRSNARPMKLGKQSPKGDKA